MTVPTMDDQSPRAAVDPRLGPGAHLREVREARRLTVEAAASQLRIDVSLLRALEADEYDNFAAPIFVTGHLRAYARLLDLAPEPLLDAYHHLGRDATPPTSAPSAAPHAPDTAGAGNGVRARLSLKADRSSWVEVRDANGQRLLYDLLDPGASRNVEGLAPFAVLLGYGPGVTVEFNGKLVDHSRYIHQDIARFRVGPIGVDKL